MILYNFDDAVGKLKKWAKSNPQAFVGFPRRNKKYNRLEIHRTDWWKDVLASKKLPEEISNYFKALCMFDDVGFFPEIAVVQNEADRDAVRERMHANQRRFDPEEGRIMFNRIMNSPNAIVLERVFVTNHSRDGRLTVWSFPMIRDTTPSYAFPMTLWMYTDIETEKEACIHGNPGPSAPAHTTALWKTVCAHAGGSPTSTLFASLRRMDKAAQEKEKSAEVSRRVQKIYEFAEKKDILVDNLKLLRAAIDENLQEIESKQPSRVTLKKLTALQLTVAEQAREVYRNPYCGETSEITETRLNVDVTESLPPKLHLKRKKK